MTEQIVDGELQEQEENTDNMEAAFDEFAASKEGDVGEQHGKGDAPNDADIAATVAANEQHDDADPLAGLTEDELRHRLKSDSGRMSALQRKVSDLESRLVQVSAQRPAAPTEPPQQWNKVQEDYSDIAEGVEALVESKLGSLDDVSRKVAYFEQRDAQARQAEELDVLAQQHPDFQEIATSPEFNEWVSRQPQPVQSLRKSNSAADAAWMLDVYKRDTGGSGGAVSNAQRVQQQRQRKLAAAVETPTHRRTPTAADESDYEGAFEQAARQLER